MNDPDRLTRPMEREPDRRMGDDGGPKSPDVTRPEGGNELLRRMKKIDPDQAKRYRQRSGQ
jgi:hypothetical protein